jgi:hypothetical protein
LEKIKLKLIRQHDRRFAKLTKIFDNRHHIYDMNEIIIIL